MGMAASQARFLGLTARKSNVEYQGQQVNQQRTALSNESANLYNQMMALDVPTPPATTDYYTTTYELEKSSGSYAKENYTFQNVTKTYANENEYNISLISKKEYVAPVEKKYTIGSLQTKATTKVISTAPTLVEGDKYGTNYYIQTASYVDDTKNETTNYIVASADKALGQLKASSSDYTYTLYPNSDPAVISAYKEKDDGTIDGEVLYYNIKDGGSQITPAPTNLGEADKNSVKIVNSKNTIPDSTTQKSYNVLSNTLTVDSISTTLIYDEQELNAYDSEGALSVTPYQIYQVDPNKELTGKGECCKNRGEGYYFYQDSKGNNHFFTLDELNDFLCKNDDKEFFETYANTYTKEVQKQVTGIMEKSSTGRFSTLKIYNDEEFPAELRGNTYSLNVKQEFDQEAYDNAMNDYNYQKDVYEKTISDINSKTAIIQKQDQNLELRLDQLDTEQNAIKTEMDAVTKVLKDNVEKTFKTFNA